MKHTSVYWHATVAGRPPCRSLLKQHLQALIRLPHRLPVNLCLYQFVVNQRLCVLHANIKGPIICLWVWESSLLPLIVFRFVQIARLKLLSFSAFRCHVLFDHDGQVFIIIFFYSKSLIFYINENTWFDEGILYIVAFHEQTQHFEQV